MSVRSVVFEGRGVGKSVCFFFFFKQKTAYEMCGRDWSSDVCSSDLIRLRGIYSQTEALFYSYCYSEGHDQLRGVCRTGSALFYAC